MKMRKLSIVLILGAAIFSWGANVAFPSVAIPEARFGVGASYDITTGDLYGVDDVPFSMNTINASFTFAPVSVMNFGVDIGTRNVRIYSSDEVFDFRGKMGFSAGGHLRLSTPLLKDVFGATALIKGAWFYSKNDYDAFYRGVDVTGALGFVFHIKQVGYISFGGKYFEIFGENQGFNDINTSSWSNDETLGGWVAFDFFPKMKQQGSYIPFVTLEAGVFPGASAFRGDKSGIHNLSFSVTIGAITQRLYGESTELEWCP